MRSISNTGGVAFVTGDVTAPLPDFVVMTEILDFQAELAPEPAPTAQVRVRVKLTLVRDSDRRILTTRTFEAVQAAASTETATPNPRLRHRHARRARRGSALDREHRRRPHLLIRPARPNVCVTCGLILFNTF